MAALIGFRGAERDVTERREQEDRIARLTRVLQMLSGINSLVPRIRDRKELLQEACRFAVKTGGYAHAVVMLRKSGAQPVQPAAWFGVDEKRTEMLCAALAGTANVGIAGRVMQDGTVFVSNDIAAAGLDSALHAGLVQAGCRSVVALPLVVDKTTIGMLLLAAPEAQVISDHELRMLRELAANLSFAVQYLQKDSTVRFLSYFNPQTGLARRSLFCERLGRLMGKSARGPQRSAVAIVDIEQLSIINDSFGRHTGDLLLQHVADRLRRHVQDTELLAQFDGGTFAVVLNVPSQAGALDPLQELITAVFARPFQLEGCELPVPVKSALAVQTDGSSDANVLVQNAETALRAAKGSGEKHLRFDAERHSKVVARLTLEHKLRVALEQQQFELHYQPKVNVKTRRIEGVEALIRWRDPEAGLISPAAFIPLLESTGLIVEVGDWVMERAALDCQQWRHDGLPPVRIAVNISPVQLRRPDFLSRFTKLTGSWASSNCGLDVEITEGTLIDDSDATLKKLERLRAAGAKIAIDDFGTGYSSLSRLADLPIDTLKIDRSFVARLRPDDRSGRVLVRTIISLARSFNMTVVAEGVETFEQLGLLWDMECDQSQGYLHSKPVVSCRDGRVAAVHSPWRHPAAGTCERRRLGFEFPNSQIYLPLTVPRSSVEAALLFQGRLDGLRSKPAVCQLGVVGSKNLHALLSNESDPIRGHDGEIRVLAHHQSIASARFEEGATDAVAGERHVAAEVVAHESGHDVEVRGAMRMRGRRQRRGVQENGTPV